jgi:hypothetical protein
MEFYGLPPIGQKQRRPMDGAPSFIPRGPVKPVGITSSTIAGVAAQIVTPLTIPPDKAGRVFMNLHGGQ